MFTSLNIRSVGSNRCWVSGPLDEVSLLCMCVCCTCKDFSVRVFADMFCFKEDLVLILNGYHQRCMDTDLNILPT